MHTVLGYMGAEPPYILIHKQFAGRLYGGRAPIIHAIILNLTGKVN